VTDFVTELSLNLTENTSLVISTPAHLFQQPYGLASRRTCDRDSGEKSASRPVVSGWPWRPAPTTTVI